MRIRRAGVVVLATVLAALLPATVNAAPYTLFTNVADSTGPFSTFGTASLNETGGVAFFATLDSGDRGVFRGANVATDTVASSAGPFAATGWDNAPVIGNNGKVVFGADLDAGGYGIFTGGNPATDTLGSTTAAGGAFQHVIGSAMSRQGTQIFYHGRVGNIGFPANVYRGPNPANDLVIDMLPLGGWATRIDVNDSGTVAFQNSGIYKGQSNATIVPVAAGAGPYNAFQTDPAINNPGTVAFLAGLVAGGSGVFKGPNPATDTIADSAGPFSSFNSVDINDAGLVAFQAARDAGGSGIYVGPNLINDKVIATGDPLFGSTVSSVGFYRGLNNNGDIAFAYQLANGQRGIAIATVPEPTGIALLSAASTMLLARRRRDVA